MSYIQKLICKFQNIYIVNSFNHDICKSDIDHNIEIEFNMIWKLTYKTIELIIYVLI